MKVRCTRLLSFDGSVQTASRWLSLGKTYDVLTIEFNQSSFHFRLVGDCGEVALFSMRAFEMVDDRLPCSWVASWSADGSFELAPKAWLGDFWERYYDGETDAVRTFEIELAKIIVD